MLSSQGFFELWHPEVWLLTLLIIGLYLLAISPRRRDWFRQSAPVPAWKAVCFVAGVLTIAISEGTPLHALSDEFLFSMHMLQHMLLVLVLPPLVLLGTPDWLLRRVLGRPKVAKVWRVLTSPLVGVLLFNFIFSLWHFPALYDSALNHEVVHALEHALFVPTAIMMWWPVLSPMPEFPRPAVHVQLFYIFLISLAQIAVFGIVTFSDRVLYTTYAHAPRMWGMTPFDDQQWAGVVMKLSAAFILTLALFIIFARWSAEEEAKEPHAQRDDTVAHH